MIYGWIVSILLAIGIAGGGYLYYINTQDTISKLTAENTILVLAVQSSEQTITILEEEAVANEEAYSALEYRNKISEEYQDELLEILHKHDLTKLATAKPGMIEKRINEGTKKVFDDLESATSNQ